MSEDLHCLDELATELDVAITRLERIVAELADASPVLVGSNMAAMRRVWSVQHRMAEIVTDVGRVPAFMVDEVRALVGERLAADDQVDDDASGDLRPRADEPRRRAHLALVSTRS
jgi:hypothetical protein